MYWSIIKKSSFFLIHLDPLIELKKLPVLLQNQLVSFFEKFKKVPTIRKPIEFIKTLELLNEYKELGFTVANILKVLKRACYTQHVIT